MDIFELKQKKMRYLEAMGGIVARADLEERDITDAEAKEYAKYEVLHDEMRQKIEAIEPKEQEGYKLADWRSGANTQGKSIVDVAVRREPVPEHMRAAAAGTGAGGGFLLSEPSVAWPGLTYHEEGLLAKCRRTQTEANATTLQMANFMESDWSSTGPFGIGFSVTVENASITESNLTATAIKFEVKAISALTRSSRLWWDATTGASRIVAEAFSTNLRWTLDKFIIAGTGVGEFRGLMNAGCKINVSRATASQIGLADVLSMKESAMPYTAPGQRYVWLASPGAFKELMDLEDSAGGNLFIQSANNAPEYRLLGHEVYVTEHCSALGVEGDLILADMNLYQIVEFGSPRLDVSSEAYFDRDQVAIKLVYFADGAPLQRAAITTSAGDFSSVVVLD